MSKYSRPDHWTRKAKARGMPARSVFKLEQIHRKVPLIRRGGRYLDCGCRPGSWSQWIREQAGADARILGVDVEPCPGFPGTFLQQGVEELTPELVAEHLGGPPDVVLSDMAPNTTGHKDTDHLRQIGLAETALWLACQLLPVGGTFVCKVFDGRDAQAFVQSVREHFDKVRRVKPDATRSSSREFFVVASGFRGRPDDAGETQDAPAG